MNYNFIFGKISIINKTKIYYVANNNNNNITNYQDLFYFSNKFFYN